MKKHLIAAGLVAAFAAPAMAQNVSVYGTIDAALNMQQNQGTADDTLTYANGTVSSSVIGLKGSEDLGGGLKAEFQMEGSYGAATGTMGTTSAFFNREAWVGLSGGFGALRFGKTDTSGVQGFDGIGSSSVLGNINDFSESIAKDKDSVLRYTSPAINGVTLHAGWANTSTATANGASDITSLGAVYSAGKIKLAYGQDEREVSGAKNDKETQVSASYDFGMAVVGVARVEVDTAANKFEGTQVAVTVPLSGGMNLGLSYRDADNTTAADYKTTAVGVNKALSKRTSVYAIYKSIDRSAADTDTDNVYLGLIHKF